MVFLNKFKYNVRLPVLDTFSIFPLSLIGFNFASLNIMDDLKSHSKKILFFGFLFIFILFKYEVFIDLGGYNGIIHIFTSLLFFVCFYLLPLDKTYIWLQKVIKQFISYTNGIYCLQSSIIHFVKLYIDKNGSLKSSFISFINLY